MDNLKEAIFAELVKLKEREWVTAKINFDFPPTITMGLTGRQLFHDKDGKLIRIFLLGDEAFRNMLYRYIYLENQNKEINRIKVSATNSTEITVEVSTLFVSEIVDAFENNLPKSMRGKTLPWWKNPEEIKDLI